MLRETLILTPAEKFKGFLGNFLGYYLIILGYYVDGFDVIDTFLFNMDNELFGASFLRTLTRNKNAIVSVLDSEKLFFFYISWVTLFIMLNYRLLHFYKIHFFKTHEISQLAT